MAHYLNGHDCSFVDLEPSEEITHALRCAARGKSLQLTLKFPSENAACEALAYDKVTPNLSLPNDTLILISCVCTRPASALPASR